MADTRSAAGEGSERSGEPKVPAQDQAAQDLAKLITETDAKGKGFWRRRKRKAASTADAPAPVGTPDATPAGTAAAAAGGSVEPSGEVAAADAPKAVAEDTAAGAQDKKVESGDDAAEVKDGAEGKPDAESDASSAKAASAEAGAKPVDAAEEDADKKDEAAEDVAADEPDETAVAEPADSEAADSEAVAEEQVEAEPRPRVGVVYEPDESPDGFPMEYGEIIIGLPKQPASKKKSAKSTEESSDDPAVDDPAVEQPTVDAADEPVVEQADAVDETPEPKVEQAEDAGDAAGEAVPADEASAEEPVGEPVGEGSGDAADEAPADEAGGDAAAEGSEAAPDEAASVEDAADEGAAEQTDAVDGGSESEVEQAEDAGDAADEAVPADEAPAEEVVGEQSADDAAAEHAAEDASTDDNPESKTDQAEAGADASGEAVPADKTSADAGIGEQAADDAPPAEGSDDVPAGQADDAPADENEAAAQAAVDVVQVQDEPGAESESAGDDKSAGEGGADGEAAAESDSASGDEPAVDGESGDGQPDAEHGDGDVEQADGDAAQAEGQPAAGAAGKAQGQAAKELVEEPAAKSVEEVAAEQAAMALITALMRLRGALASSRLPLDVVGADEARQQQKEMLDQLDDYVLPRLVQLEAPVLAVVGGSTGAGKSTLVNSLIGEVVSEPGVLRPTTRSPVLIHNSADAEWFAGDRVLPGMARSSGDSPGGMEDPGQIRLVASDTVPQGLAILDAPDIDSVVEANRDLATQLLAAADLWLFVTTAARYADAVPWDFLQSASDRSTAVAVVLDRAPADTIDDITGHLAQMLLERGLGDSPLFSIKETVVDGNGMLPSEVVASIKDWLIDLAADADARSAVVRRTLHGAVTAMTKKAPAFAKAVRAQADTAADLRQTAETAYERAAKDIATATQDGTMLRGEVLARWQEFVGTGELLKGLQTNVGRMRDKVRTSVVGKPPPTRDLNDAVESGLESLLREHAEAAAERAEESWQSTAAGRQLLAAGDRDMGRMSKEFPAEAGRLVREWQGYVLDLVRKEGADKRSTARILAYGVNGLGLSLMIVIFASTAGIPTGAEVGAGLGTAVVGQKLLEAVFGDQAVRTLAAKARDDLDGKVHALMDAEFARYLAVLDQHPVDPDTPRQLTEAARAVEDCT
ncbi:AAA family ATPase [Kribbella qitaiheensis]|uniref:AAA family ATPase n=1 Tax=Kribbella qitaiheensis TaxID=1544730 RepID=UPI003606AFD8